MAAGSDPFPLSSGIVLKFAAALRSAGKSAGLYLGVRRLAHVERNHEVGPALKRTFDLCRKALSKGQGPPSKAPELQLDDFDKKGREMNLKRKTLAFPYLTYALALCFLLRRIELENLRWKDIEIPKDRSKVTLLIRTSKPDQESKAVRRTLGCTCNSTKSMCPVEIASSLKDKMEEAWPDVKDSAKAWVTRSTEKLHLEKAAVVTAWSAASRRPVQGHSPRRSGALYHTREGLSVGEVTYLGRWHSSLWVLASISKQL